MNLSLSDLFHIVWKPLFCSFYGWIILHYVSALHLLYLFLCHWVLGSFCILAIVNSAAVNFRVHMSFQIMSSQEICPGVGLLGHSSSIFSFSRAIILFLRSGHVYVCSVAHSCPIPCDPRTLTHEAPLSIEFSRQEYCSRLPFPTPGDLPDPGVEPKSPALAGGFCTTEPPGKPPI